MNMRAKQFTKILELSHDVMERIKNENQFFNTKNNNVSKQDSKIGKKYPLDYIQEVPSINRNRRISQKNYEKMKIRRNILKNVVFRRIIEIRQAKRRPKLKDLIQLFSKKLGGEKSNKVV